MMAICGRASVTIGRNRLWKFIRAEIEPAGGNQSQLDAEDQRQQRAR